MPHDTFIENLRYSSSKGFCEIKLIHCDKTKNHATYWININSIIYLC